MLVLGVSDHEPSLTTRIASIFQATTCVISPPGGRIKCRDRARRQAAAHGIRPRGQYDRHTRAKHYPLALRLPKRCTLSPGGLGKLLWRQFRTALVEVVGDSHRADVCELDGPGPTL